MKNKIQDNIDELRKILGEFQLEDTTVAEEFLDAIEENAISLKDELTTAEQEIKEYENNEKDADDEEVELVNSDFVGLDTINWSLENGNLIIQQKMEYFIEQLQKQNAVVPV